MFIIIINQSFAFSLVLERNRNKRDVPVPVVPKKDFIILLPCLGLQSNQIPNRLKSCIYQLTLVLILRYFFKTPAVLNLSLHTRTALIALKDLKSFTNLVVRIVMIFTLVKPSDGSMIGRLKEDRKSLTRNDHSSAIADHINTIGHNIKWDHFAPGLQKY